ncbi:spermidine/putrescine ABC transporter permease [Brevundimonas sp. Leaf363]|uniref:ABC transporter permease n=1 Tax=Brevundimonas sp. Leaf363 TaxID=1736353 RepID=UPI0006F84E9D|nr:ABC transporter permease [Brevundimonas sp. Leaf363]KQS53877.1 spermidine/putrescine ABC transporter permease [Brevundimonas sp. Leaf363]
MRSTIDWRRNPVGFIALLGPPLVWFLVFFAVPMAVVLGYSFGTNSGLTEIEISGTFANYARALEPLYLGILGKSLLFSALATLICLLVGFPVALAIAFAPPNLKTWLLIGVMLPFWTNLLIRTYALIAILRDEGVINGVLSFLLGWAGFEPLRLMNTNTAVVIGLVYVHLPFMVLPLYAALDRLDRSLIEAALDLGASHLRAVMTVVVPLAGAGIASGLLLTFIPVLGSYLAPDLLGGPDSLMIANVIERQFKRANDWPFGAALAFLLMYMTFAGILMQALWKGRRPADAD